MNGKTSYKWHRFSTISKEQLYDVLNLRQRVFIIEQDCFYEDIDYFDQKAHHLLAYKDERLIGYARVFPPGIKYDSASIGRIVVDIECRGKDYGKEITNQSIKYIKINFPNSNIAISAQFRLRDFYSNLGFKKKGKVYLEDDIEHIKMVLDLKNKN